MKHSLTQPLYSEHEFHFTRLTYNVTQNEIRGPGAHSTNHANLGESRFSVKFVQNHNAVKCVYY